MQRFGAVNHSGCARQTLCSHYITEHRFQNTPEALNDLGQKYTSDLLVTSEPSRPLTSAGTGFHFTPRVGGKPLKAVFSSNAATIWNKFPVNCKSTRALGAVASTLERFMFAAAYRKTVQQSYFVFYSNSAIVSAI